jgi:hypothetical protein
MIITAKFASTCPHCSSAIAVGAKVNWTKGAKATHVACGAAVASSVAPARGRNWNADKFNGYGRAKGGYGKACISDGNCSSIGSGRSCGGHDCDGY